MADYSNVSSLFPQMTDYEKLMRLLRVPEEKWEGLFVELCSHNLSLILEIRRDGSIAWGTL